MTRSTPNKRSKIKIPSSPFVKTKNLLSPSYVDGGLIGRDIEYKKLFKIIHDGLADNISRTIYISGPAGTGKTLTTNTVINDLKNEFKMKFIDINCMSFQNASEFYEKILSNFDKKCKRICASNCNSQVQLFSEIKNSIYNSKNMVIFLLDEIDQLQTKNLEVINNIFKLPLLYPENVILIGIANALDFTAKMPWLKDQKTIFDEIRFLPYKKEQIVKIIENRLNHSNNEKVLIDQNAIEFCARKIASCSGDIRKALDVCRRAVELFETNSHINPLKSREFQQNIENNERSTIKQVNIKLMVDVLKKVYGNATDKIESRTFLPSDQQVILCVFLIYFKIKSSREIRLPELREILVKICKKNGISSEGKSESDILNMCQYLADYGYVSVMKKDTTAMNNGSPFKKIKKVATITLTLLIDPFEAEQLISPFHKSLIADAFSYF